MRAAGAALAGGAWRRARSAAKELRESDQRGEATGLSAEELAFYEALEINDSAVNVLGDETLKTIAREMVEAIRRNITIDWTVRESVRAKMRVMVKRILRKYGYPPDKQSARRQPCWNRPNY